MRGVEQAAFFRSVLLPQDATALDLFLGRGTLQFWHAFLCTRAFSPWLEMETQQKGLLGEAKPSFVETAELLGKAEPSNRAGARARPSCGAVPAQSPLPVPLPPPHPLLFAVV